MYEGNEFKEKMGEGRRHKKLILDALNSPNRIRNILRFYRALSQNSLSQTGYDQY
jgi:hypothetical protein